jgi:Putative addiction module component
MPVPIHFPPPGFDDLSIDEKLDYLELLWERIATSPEPVVVPEWHREVISERLREIESDPNCAHTLPNGNGPRAEPLHLDILGMAGAVCPKHLRCLSGDAALHSRISRRHP